jgi:DNA-binding NarL/FixJ family response regulator
MPICGGGSSLHRAIVEPRRDVKFKAVKQTKRSHISVLVAEDHPMVADGIEAILDSAGDMVVIGRARDGAEAIQLLQRYQPDIALLDLRMPVVDGIGVARWIMGSGSNTRAVMLTSFQSESDVSQAIRAGVKAYLLKDTPPDEILKTIRRVHGGRVGTLREPAQKFVPEVDASALTILDLEILRLILHGHNNRAIGLKLGLRTDAVKYHLRGLFSKLGVKRRAAAARQAIERGLVPID